MLRLQENPFSKARFQEQEDLHSGDKLRPGKKITTSQFAPVPSGKIFQKATICAYVSKNCNKMMSEGDSPLYETLWQRRFFKNSFGFNYFYFCNFKHFSYVYVSKILKSIYPLLNQVLIKYFQLCLNSLNSLNCLNSSAYVSILLINLRQQKHKMHM